MSRIKKTSLVLERAHQRLSGMESVDPALDLGNGLTTITFNAQVDTFQDRLDKYNQHISDLDAERNDLLALEKLLRETNKTILQGVGVKYGYDSNEYEKVGGTRTSERKKPHPKSKNGTASDNAAGQTA